MSLTLLAGLTLVGVSIGILILGWVLYPTITRFRAQRLPALTAKLANPRPVSIVIATRESPSIIESRIANLLANGYPPDCMEIVVAVDPTSSYRESDYAVRLPASVRVVVGDSPGGKSGALNAAMRLVRQDIVVFADSVPEYRVGAIEALVGFLASHHSHGAVTGVLELQAGAHAPDGVLTRLWQLELALRRAQAALHSVCVVTGCIYAIRRALWRPLPLGAICDDLFVPMRIIRSGHRVGVCDAAMAIDRRVFTRKQDFQRKVRTLTGMLQFVRACPWALVPGLNPVWTQFAFHKLLRIATPFLLLGAGLGALSCAIALGVLAWIWLALGAALLAMAAFAVSRPTAANRLATQVAWGVALLCAPLVAVWNAVLGRWDVWRSHASPIGPT